MTIYKTKSGYSYYVCKPKSDKCTKYTWNPDKDRYVKVRGTVYKSTIERMLKRGLVKRAKNPPKAPRRRGRR